MRGQPPGDEAFAFFDEVVDHFFLDDGTELGNFVDAFEGGPDTAFFPGVVRRLHRQSCCLLEKWRVDAAFLEAGGLHKGSDREVPS